MAIRRLQTTKIWSISYYGLTDEQLIEEIKQQESLVLEIPEYRIARDLRIEQCKSILEERNK